MDAIGIEGLSIVPREKKEEFLKSIAEAVGSMLKESYPSVCVSVLTEEYPLQLNQEALFSDG